jgi:hypothetical protein
MQRLHFARPNDLGKLHDELLAARIVPERVEGLGDDIWLTVPESVSVAAITAIVEAHDPTPRPEPPTVEERLAAVEAAQLESLLGGL